MARKKREQRRERRDSNKRIKKKVSVLDQESVEWVDYKDVELLKRFMSDRAKIRARRVTGNSTQQQKAVARAIKLARELALLPYTQRVATSARGKKRRRDDDDDDRGDRRDDRRGPRGRDDERSFDEADTMSADTDDTDDTGVEAGAGDDTGTADVADPAVSADAEEAAVGAGTAEATSDGEEE